MFKNVKTKLISIVLALVMLLSLGAAIIGAESGDAISLPDPIEVKKIAIGFGMSEEDVVSLYYELGSLEAIRESFNQYPDYELFSISDINNLYEEGVSVIDMEKADELSYYCEYSSMEILQLKLAYDKNDEKAWDKVLKDLGMDKYYKFDKTVFTNEQIDILLLSEYSQKDIYDMDELSKKYIISFERIFFDYENGLTYKDLKEVYKLDYENSDDYKLKKEKEDKEMQDIIFNAVLEEIKKKEDGGN